MIALAQCFKRLLLAGLLALPAAASAIEPEDVREYGDVFVVSGFAPDRSSIEVSWDIAPDYYLYNNEFLSFTSGTPGVALGEPIMPRGEVKYDELLGEEVERYEGELTVEIPIRSVEPDIRAMQLQVRSQGCLEKVLCYPPTTQVVLIGFAPRDTNDGAVEPAAVPIAEPTAQAAQSDHPISDSLANLVDDPLAGIAQYDSEPALQPEDAFKYEVIGLSAETALVRFTIQPGYYLYRDKFVFRVLSPEGFSVREVSLPEGQNKDDPEFGLVPVYYDQVEIPVRLDRPAGPARDVTLEADFQGCRDGDICYPPMTRAVAFDMDPSATAISEGSARSSALQASPAPSQARPPDQGPGQAPPPVSEQDRLARVLTDSPSRAMLVFFFAGLLLAFTPCVFPMLPILSGIIAGEGTQLNTVRAFWLSLIYVLAMAITYTIAGVLAGLFGQNLQAAFQNPWIISGFVAIFILLALAMFGFYELQLPSRLQSKLAKAGERQRGGRFTGVAVMGFLSALIVGPCVAPPLMAALIVIGASGDAVLGGSALFALSLGMGVPLVVFGTSAGKILPRAGPWMKQIQAVFGVGLLALSIWLLERILPGGLIMVLWGILAIACGIFLGVLERLPEGASGWRRLWKALGMVLLLAGAMELVGAAAGGDNWTRPLERLGVTGSAADAEDHVQFRRIKSSEDLNIALEQASASGKGAMLDFYADWCVECIRMERNTFPDESVQALLSQLQPLQADVTPHDEVDQALMRRFGIIGPPAILFFDRAGQEMKAYRLVGYFAPSEFASHLRAVLAAQ
jgi:thiol:disulfide interchange protein DsbD